MIKNRYKIILAYNGQNYHGWAIQHNLQTIQGILQQAIYKSFNQKVTVYGASRTDAGVNALYQVCHFDLKKIAIKPKNICKIINKILPYDIKIINIKKVGLNFNSRFDTKNKTYKYFINISKINPIESSFIYQYNKNLSIKDLKKCSKLFVGKKNFLSFSTDQRIGETLVRKINSIFIQKKKNLIIISINGDGFLRSQVRMIVGTMIAYCNKKISITKINMLFKNPKKGAALFKAPACGLTLAKINY